MFGEFFAYYLGKSAGRVQARKRRRRDLTADDVARMWLAVVVIAVCAALVISASISS
jgi:hypothetical protein